MYENGGCYELLHDKNLYEFNAVPLPKPINDNLVEEPSIIK